MIALGSWVKKEIGTPTVLVNIKKTTPIIQTKSTNNSNKTPPIIKKKPPGEQCRNQSPADGLCRCLLRHLGASPRSQHQSRIVHDQVFLTLFTISRHVENVILCSEFLPDMRRRRKGHVVNITSVMERDAVKGFAVYAGTKHFWTGEYEDKGVMMKYF